MLLIYLFYTVYYLAYFYHIPLFVFSIPVFSVCYEFLHCSIHCIPENEKWNNLKILKSDKMAEAYKKKK